MTTHIKHSYPPYVVSRITLEKVISVKLLKTISPLNIFEFVTYRGDTTRLLLENISHVITDLERISTLDIKTTDGVSFQGDDELLAQVSVSSTRKYLKSEINHLVKQIYQDSLFFDTAPYKNKFQFIFIDANHEYKYVKKRH